MLPYVRIIWSTHCAVLAESKDGPNLEVLMSYWRGEWPRLASECCFAPSRHPGLEQHLGWWQTELG